MSYLVLLAIQILFAPHSDWHVFAQLERWPVDAVVGAERGGENQSLHKRGSSTRLQRCVQNIRRIRPKIRSEEVTDRRLRNLFEVLLNLRLLRPPGEVGIGLR